jgi:hypothetical protein
MLVFSFQTVRLAVPGRNMIDRMEVDEEVCSRYGLRGRDKEIETLPMRTRRGLSMVFVLDLHCQQHETSESLSRSS